MISIIIATLNEEQGIAKVICSIPKKIREKSEVIVVDVSSDLTPVIAKSLGAKVIKFNKKGKGRQMRLGVERSKGDTLIFMDGDCTDPPQYIPKLLKALETSNLVLGCRYMKDFEIDDRNLRRIFRVYGFFITRLFRLIKFNVSGDPLAGFRAIRRKDWDKLALESDDFRIETEMNVKAVRNGFVVKEVPIPHLKRCGGGLKGSKLLTNPRQIIEMYKLILKYVREEQLVSRLKSLESRIRARIKF